MRYLILILFLTNCKTLIVKNFDVEKIQLQNEISQTRSDKTKNEIKKVIDDNIKSNCVNKKYFDFVTKRCIDEINLLKNDLNSLTQSHVILASDHNELIMNYEILKNNYENLRIIIKNLIIVIVVLSFVILIFISFKILKTYFKFF